MNIFKRPYSFIFRTTFTFITVFLIEMIFELIEKSSYSFWYGLLHALIITFTVMATSYYFNNRKQKK
jgi:arabinogalactan endo-1,4-beta-galactosidase